MGYVVDSIAGYEILIMLKLFFWLRYLRKKKIVFLSVVAVAMSVSLLIVVANLFAGFINAFEQAGVEVIGDIVLAPPIKFSQYEMFVEELEQIGQVKAATATLLAQGLLHFGQGNVRAVNIYGVEPVSRAEVTDFKQSLIKQNKLHREPSFEVPGYPERIGGFVGIGVAAEPDEKTDKYDLAEIEKIIGQQVVLTTGSISRIQERNSTRTRIKRRTARFTVTDIVFTGVYDLDKKFVYLPIEELQKTLYPNLEAPLADQIQIKLIGDAHTDMAMAQIRGLWQSFATEQLGWGTYLIKQTTIATAKQMQSQYIAEVRKQMGVLLLIFGIVSCSVILLIFCIFYMIVMTKKKDIAIIKSCGATCTSILLIFIGFGACIGIIGSGAGTVLGYIVTRNISTIEEWIRIVFGLKLWKSSVYMFDKIPNEIVWSWALPIVLLAVLAASVGALIPAIVAVRTRPVEILRYE